MEQPGVRTATATGARIVDTFAEAFPMTAARVVVTADSREWARIAAETMTGYATSVIACDAEAGIERALDGDETPDGRPGFSVLVFAFNREALEKALANRVGQCVMTCPTTACYNGLPVGEKTVNVGGRLRYFGDGWQISKKIGGRRYWRIPVMDGEFLCEEIFGTIKGVAGGNLIVMGADAAGTLAAVESAVAAIRRDCRDVILPFPGGIARSGSKVGSKYKGLRASTNTAFAPTLRGVVKTELPPDARCTYEIVIDGLTLGGRRAGHRDRGPRSGRPPGRDRSHRGQLRRQPRAVSHPPARRPRASRSERMIRALFCLTLLPASMLRADEPGIIDAMDTLRFQQPKNGAAQLVVGRSGQAVRFHFDRDSQGSFATSNIRGTSEWDRAAGFSFWVKGDGTDQVAGLEFIFDEDYAVRYDFAFPIKGTEWKKVTAAWSDLVPVLPGPKARPLGAKDGNPPSKLSGFWFGRWWYWGDYPALTITVDDIRLEPTIVRDADSHRPEGEPLARVRAKLEGGRSVTIVTMGDSLTDKRHWANRPLCWVDLLRDRIKDRFHCDVTLVNPATGGTQLRQNVILIPRWLDRAGARSGGDLLRR